MTTPSNPFSISKLHCIPNEIDASKISQYYGPPEGYTFWRVYVDDHLLSDFSQPFTADDPVIELLGNLEVPIWGDGWGFISVRQTGQYVIWSTPIEGTVDDYAMHSALPDNKFIVFDLAEYTETLSYLPLPAAFLSVNAGRAKRSSYNIKYLPFANSETALPQLFSTELCWLIRDFLPEDDLPLYRIPEKSNDTRGVKLLRSTKAALQRGHEDIIAVKPPSSWHEIRIGLDVRDFEECVWYVGKTGQGCAIFFHSNPHFPLWITSSTLNDSLNEECDSVV